MGFRLIHWTGMADPGEREMKAILRREGLQPRCWANRPGERYRPHNHSYGKVIYCLSREIVFHVAGNRVTLSPGDRLEIGPDTTHAAFVGPRGVVCLEANRSPY